MSKISSEVAQFSCIGQLLGVVIKEGDKIKYLRVNVSEREYWIKLPKELRYQLNTAITPGSWLEIQGTQESCPKKGIVKLRAETVNLASKLHPLSHTVVLPQATAVEKKTPKACILICQKSDCWKRGGKAVCELLEESLRDRGLDDKVQIKRTGCLKDCKRGPNVVMMPDKKRYSQVTLQQVETLLEKHFI